MLLLYPCEEDRMRTAARCLLSQARIKECDCECPCNCLVILSVAVNKDKVVIETDRAVYDLRCSLELTRHKADVKEY